MSHILVATGVKREAATLHHQPGLVVIPGGGDPVGLRAKLEAAAEGARGIVSFGMAGALAEGLAIGDWIIGDRLSGATEAICDPAWSSALAAQLPGARIGGIYADGRLIGTAAEKLSLGAAHHALAVDMESHIAAAIAADYGLPFAIVRCISDIARHEMPPAITVAMRADGGVDGAAVLRSLVMQPGQFPDLIATVAGFSQAMSALKRGAARMAPQLGVSA